jgi:hypothetical protein
MPSTDIAAAEHLTKDFADGLALAINKDEDDADRWAYTVVQHGERYVIAVADETGFHLGYL